MSALPVSEFKRLLQIGLGRAILYLQKHDATPYREVILDACLHNVAYDPQVEEGRANYMLEIIEATNDKQFYRDKILAALAASSYESLEWDVQQLFAFAEYLVLHGDVEARSIIYDKFVDSMALADFAGANSIVRIDGVEGFLFVADQLGGKILNSGPEFPFGKFGPYWVDGQALMIVEAQVGQEVNALLTDSTDNPRIEAYLTIARAYRDAANKLIEPKPENFLSYTELRDLIGTAKVHRTPRARYWVRWGKQASTADLIRAANDMLIETNRERLLTLMTMFREVPFPLDHNRLISLIDSNDEQIAAEAFNTLQQINHPTVRALAFRMAESATWVGKAVSLLTSNYQDGDWQFIERVTTRNLDDEYYHSLGHSVIGVFDVHPTKDSAAALINLYERGPCANCRSRFVKRLHKLDVLPEWMREECLHDSDFDLRQMVKHDFVNSPEGL
jgi:hypothetical protein